MCVCVGVCVGVCVCMKIILSDSNLIRHTRVHAWMVVNFAIVTVLLNLRRLDI